MNQLSTNQLNNSSASLNEALLRPIPKLSLKAICTIFVFAGVLIWSANGSEIFTQDYVGGIPSVIESLSRWLPPDFDIVWSEPSEFFWPLSLFTPLSVPYPKSIIPIIETIQMAIIGTVFGVILSLPFGFFAARNTSPHVSVYYVTRFLLNINRTIPEIVFAIIFVAGFGMGPFAGVLALAIGAIGTLGKIFAESVESIDPQQVLGIQATGANRMLSFMYGVLPQALPTMASYSLLYFEHNVRAATILGLVGAGGIGFYIQDYLNRFWLDKLMGAVILLIIMVTIIDRISDWLRNKII